MSARVGTAELPGLPIDDIGLSAYANVGELTSMDFTRITSSFDSGTIDQSEDYVSGSMTIGDNAAGTVNVSVYVNLNGWLIAYFERSIPAARIVRYNENTETTYDYDALEEALRRTLEGLPSIAFSTVQKSLLYYNFEYPEANAIMIICDWADADGTKANGSYSITIPNGVTLYEVSFRLTHDAESRDGSSDLYFNNSRILFTQSDDSDITVYTTLSTSQIQSDTPYLIATADYDYGYTFSAAVLIYKK